MTFDFIVYPVDGSTPLSFTVAAPSEDAARRELEQRLRGVGLTGEELAWARVAVTIVRKGRP